MAFHAAQMVFSHGRMKAFAVGPMEWVWRTLAYGSVPSIRRGGVFTTLPPNKLAITVVMTTNVFRTRTAIFGQIVETPMTSIGGGFEAFFCPTAIGRDFN